MTIEKLIKESIQEELRSRIASALEEKFAKKTDKDDDGEGMDPVDKKASKKDFDDREDKDIDNDGDTDDSDEYLHNRRKAIGKSIGKKKVNEAVKTGYYFWDTEEVDLYPEGGHFKTFKDISKIDTDKFYVSSDADNALAIGYMDDTGFYSVDTRGNKKRKIKI